MKQRHNTQRKKDGKVLNEHIFFASTFRILTTMTGEVKWQIIENRKQLKYLEKEQMEEGEEKKIRNKDILCKKIESMHVLIPFIF